jgi:23S rRNA pseudouridine2605 synthase
VRPPPRFVRLQKIIAAAGVASRRRAEELLREGRVSVNDRRAELGESADPERDVVAVDGKPLRQATHAYWMLNKPRGVLTTVRDTHGRPTVVDLLPDRSLRLFPVGRLDRDTEGLVLLTNDGELAHVLLHPSFESEREYQVTVAGRIAERTLRRLAAGVPLDGRVSAPARVERAKFDPRSQTSRFRLTLIEGRKRQIRRALAALGHPVAGLRRIRMGPLRLGRLSSGSARPLTAREVRCLLRCLARSRRDASRRRP